MTRYRISFYSIAHTLICVMRVRAKSANRAVHSAYIRADRAGHFIGTVADYAIDQNGTTYCMVDKDGYLLGA